MPLIEAENISKSYLGMLPVLENSSFRIESGEFFYLTGVSGAGKTTVFKLLMLMERPDTGRVSFDGQDITLLETRNRSLHRRRIGMVFQDYRLLDNETIEENVAIPLRVGGHRGPGLRRQTENLLEQVGLADRRREKVLGLSGGEKQLVSIARALSFNPGVFFADEPTGNLDQSMAFRVMDLIKEIHRKGATVIVATHDLNLIRTFRARTLLIKDRRIHEVRLADSQPSL
ncbi:MAG: ATP-binding cassette domain-containing protein [Deltaproteobacteria bacterium]|nr:ATP-binding cassette domain-containing protein [Deltaproteobacteria bacterium]